MYPNQPLPFSPDQLQNPFLPGIGPNSPPFVPQIPGLQPWMNNYVPAIAGWAAAEIQNSAEMNQLRRFFFNMFARNSFANEDFVALVQGILEHLELQISTNPQQRPENLLQTIIPNTVEMFVANMTRMWPQLTAYLTPHQQQMAMQMCMTFDNIKANVQRMKQGAMMPQPQGYFPQQGMMQQTGMVRADPRLAGGSLGVSLTGPAPSLSGPSTMMANPQGRSMSDRFASYNLPDLSTPRATGTVVNQSSEQQEASNVRVASAASAPLPQSKESTTVSTPAQAQDGPLEDLLTSKLKWKRSDVQPYFPAWNPAEQKLYLQRLADGTVVVRLKRLDKDNMDYERHKIPSVFGPMLPQLNLSDTKKTLDILSKGMEQIAQERAERAENVEKSFSTRVNEKWVADVSSDLIWITVACNWLSASEQGKRPDIYRQYGNVVEIVVGSESEQQFIESFGKAGTWANLHQMLNESYGVASATLWHRVNQRVTDFVNRMLTFNLSLTGLTIDSFALDGLEIIEYLKSTYGEVVANAFLHNQSARIRSLFETLDMTVQENLDSNFLPDPEESDGTGPKPGMPVLTHLVANASFTFLNCLSHELSVEFSQDEPAIVTPTLTPVLFKLAESIVEEADAKSTSVLYHYVQTLDGRILELDRGYIGEDTYILRKLK